MEKNIDQLIKEQNDRIKKFDLSALTEDYQEYKKELIELDRLQSIKIAQLKVKAIEFWDEIALDMKIKH